MLDLLDRPFRWAGAGLRTAAGWAALAMLAAALANFVLAK
jgi:hypothetical protein